MVCSMLVPIHSCCCQPLQRYYFFLPLSAAGAMFSSDELRTYIVFAYIIHLGWVWVGWVGWANNVLALAYSLYFCTTSSYVRISVSWCCVTRFFLDFMLRYVAYSCTSYTTSSYAKTSLSWCYVTKISLDLMLRYDVFPCVSSLPTWKVGKKNAAMIEKHTVQNQ